MSGSDRGRDNQAVEWVIPLVGIVLVAFLAWGIGYLEARETYNRQQTAATYEQATKEDAKRTCVGIEPSAVFECVDEKVKTAYQTAHDEQELAAEQRSASSALASAVLSFLALAISAVAVWYVKRTLDATLEAVEDTSTATEAMKEANWIAQDTAKHQLRAYVIPAGADFKISESGEIEAKLIIRNFGQTPALEERTWIHMWIADCPMNEELPKPDKNFVTGVGVVGPRNHSEFHNSRPRIDEHSLRKIEDGTAALYLYGEIKYADIFGDLHTTGYVYFTNGTVGWARGRFSQYFSGNYAT